MEENGESGLGVFFFLFFQGKIERVCGKEEGGYDIERDYLLTNETANENRQNISHVSPIWIDYPSIISSPSRTIGQT